VVTTYRTIDSGLTLQYGMAKGANPA